MPSITFEIDDNGNTSLSIKGPKRLHDLKGDFDKDLGSLVGDSKTTERPDLTEAQRTAVPPQAQARKA